MIFGFWRQRIFKIYTYSLERLRTFKFTIGGLKNFSLISQQIAQALVILFTSSSEYGKFLCRM